MAETDILLDTFTRVYESLHRTLADISAAELMQEPHPLLTYRSVVKACSRLLKSSLE